MSTPEDAAPTEPLEPSTPPAASTTTPAAVRPKTWTRLITPVLAVVAALVIGLFGGILIGQHTSGAPQAGSARQGGGFGQAGQGGQNQGNRFGQGQGGAGQQGARPGGAAGGFTAGTIESIDGSTITLKQADGTEVKISTTDSTAVTKTEKGSVSDLKKGQTVVVRGEKGDDGTLSATSVSEGQAGFARGGAPRAGAGN